MDSMVEIRRQRRPLSFLQGHSGRSALGFNPKGHSGCSAPGFNPKGHSGCSAPGFNSKGHPGCSAPGFNQSALPGAPLRALPPGPPWMLRSGLQPQGALPDASLRAPTQGALPDASLRASTPRAAPDALLRASTSGPPRMHCSGSALCCRSRHATQSGIPLC